MAEVSGGVPQSMIDAIAALQARPTLTMATTDPLVANTPAACGSSGTVAHGDHVHPPQVIPAMSMATPTSRAPALATAYQATDPTKPALVTVNLTSTANLSLTGGTTNSADIVIGATNAVTAGTGTVIGKYSNASTGTLTIGLNTNAVAAQTTTFGLPTGWYWAIRQILGAVTITSGYDMAFG